MTDERPTVPAALAAYLDAHELHYNVVPGVTVHHAKNVEAAAKAIGTDSTSIVRSHLWRAEDGSVALVIAAAAAKIDPAKLVAATGREGWTLALPAVAHGVTGFGASPTIGVPPVGPGYGDRFPVLIDTAVMAHPVIFGGGGRANVLLCVLPREIAPLMNAEMHDLTKPAKPTR